MSSSAADDGVSRKDGQYAKDSKEALEERTGSAEVAVEKLAQELGTMMNLLGKQTEASARATEQHSELILRASTGVKNAVKHLEEETMSMLKEAADLHALLGGLSELGRETAKVRRELFALELDVVKLHQKAVGRMSRAASARSARMVRADVGTELEVHSAPLSEVQNVNEGEEEDPTSDAQ